METGNRSDWTEEDPMVGTLLMALVDAPIAVAVTAALLAYLAIWNVGLLFPGPLDRLERPRKDRPNPAARSSLPETPRPGTRAVVRTAQST